MFYDPADHPENHSEGDDSPFPIEEAELRAFMDLNTIALDKVYDVVSKTTHLIAQLKITAASLPEEQRINRLYATRDQLVDKFETMLIGFNESMNSYLQGPESDNG